MTYKKLLIVDLDGTLIDTEKPSVQHEISILRNFYKGEIDQEEYRNLIQGITLEKTIQIVAKRYQVSLPDNYIDLLLENWHDQVIRKAIHAPYAREALMELQKNYEICLASNGESDNVDVSIEVLGFEDIFPKEKRFTKDLVQNPKPAPDLFQYVMKHFGFETHQSFSIEDSKTGVTAAISANIYSLGYVGLLYNPEQQRQELLKSGANIVFDSWRDIAEFLRPKP